MRFSRRVFLGLLGLSAGNLIFSKYSYALSGKYVTLIDIRNCDGCRDLDIPLCVKACRDQNKDRFPEPKKPILPYWPRKTYEDWSDKKNVIDTLTPYNWIFIQKVEVEGKVLYIPRRCMHCDSPPCVKGCPFGALTKQPEGNSVINHEICFGGAKCREVCPWNIPQRQAGVGIYLKLLPKYAGGGVMYKCDMCDARIKRGEEPACVLACKDRLKEKAVFLFGERGEIHKIAFEKVKKEGLYLYGDRQNGGTSTLYLSPVSFEKIDECLKTKRARFRMPTEVKNRYLSEINTWGKALLGISIGSLIIGGVLGFSAKKEEHNG